MVSQLRAGKQLLLVLLLYTGEIAAAMLACWLSCMVMEVWSGCWRARPCPGALLLCVDAVAVHLFVAVCSVQHAHHPVSIITCS
jgi:hypothetical protein